VSDGEPDPRDISAVLDFDEFELDSVDMGWRAFVAELQPSIVESPAEREDDDGDASLSPGDPPSAPDAPADIPEAPWRTGTIRNELGVPLDIGQVWVRWTPARAEADPWLAQAVAGFEPLDNPAGQAAAAWLRNRSLVEFGSVATRLMVVDRVVEGFYSLAASQVEIKTRDRLGMTRSRTQPAALVQWLAKRRGSSVSGWEILAHAIGTALKVSEDLGLVAIVLEPYDEASADIWRADPYRFKTSRTTGPGGTPRLWRSLIR
jgi:hypothetical protein